MQVSPFYMGSDTIPSDSTYTRTGNWGMQLNFAVPLDGGMIELCKSIARKHEQKLRLDYEIVRALKCAELQQKGFTFRPGTKIDLRMNPQLGIDASEWIREQKASDLAKVLKTNSDLNASLKLAEELKKVVSTKELYSDDIICFLEELFPKASKDWNSLAARILQAIRMELNEELDQIDQIVNAAKKLLIPGGKLVFLTYHSVEDRKVKKTLRELEQEEKCPPNILPQKFNGRPALFKRLSKKPILPSDAEIQKNSRARSAKMRVYERI